MGVWPSSSHVFRGLTEGLWLCPQRTLLGVLKEDGEPSMLLQAARSLYNQNEWWVHILGHKIKHVSGGCPVWKRQCCIFAFLQMMLYCCFHQAITLSVCWSSLQLSVKQIGWQSAHPILRPRFSARNGQIAAPVLGVSSYPRWSTLIDWILLTEH